MSQTLLLTSGGMKFQIVRDEVLKLISKQPKDIQIAHIITASKHTSDPSWVIDDSNGVKELGFNVEEVDIEGKGEDELLSILSDKDIVYVQGGDPFFLLKQIRLNGFDKVIKKLLDKDVIYIGHSAGTYVACPTLEMALWHKPNRERHGITDLTGMNLVPVIITVHYEEARRQAYLQGISSTNIPVKILNDDQALLFKDGKMELVGDTNEIVL
jgi:dipeptidase E